MLAASHEDAAIKRAYSIGVQALRNTARANKVESIRTELLEMQNPGVNAAGWCPLSHTAHGSPGQRDLALAKE